LTRAVWDPACVLLLISPITSRRVQSTILLIGPSAEGHATGAAVLRLQGYEVLTAANGPEAEVLGQRLGLEHLDLVIRPPRHTSPHLPFILVSDGALPVRLDPPVVW
jgi:hypothetical protein